MDDPAGVRVGHGVADRDEGVQQYRQVERVGLARRPLPVVGPGRLAQGAALEEAHGVERLAAVPHAEQVIHRNDTGVFQLAGDPRLLEKARPERGVPGTLGAQLLEGHVAAEIVVVGQPGAADAAGSVQAESGVTLARPGYVVHRGGLVCGLRLHGQPGERAPNVVVSQGRQGAFDIVGDGRQAGPGIAAVLVQFAPSR